MKYPAECYSLYCGWTSADPQCQKCPSRPRLDAYKKWKAKQPKQYDKWGKEI